VEHQFDTQPYGQFVAATRRGRPIDDRDASIKPPTLSDIVGWFKSMTTWDYGIGVRKYGWPPFRGRLWQRGFYDHIVRTEADLARISDCIANNPVRWKADDLFTV